ECPIFITYKKDSEDKRNAKYRNDLQNGKSLRWYTRSPRHIDSDEVQRLLAKDKMGNYKIKLHLFVKRSDADGKGFYYLGEGKIVSDRDRKSTRLNSSHVSISYADFCLKKKRAKQ